MLRAFIADDEPKICRLIKKLIDWNSLEIELCGVANDGIDAYNQIKSIEPDIIITDIRMPGYDGIELITKIKEILPNCHFIIISGYRDYLYANSALKLGVEEYMLKPVNKVKLTEVLENIRKRCTEEDRYSPLDMYEIQMQQKVYILDLITNMKNNISDPIASSELFDCKFSYPNYQAIIVTLDSDFVQLNSDNYNEGKYQLYKIIDTYFRETYECLLTNMLDFGLLVFIPIYNDERTKVESYYKEDLLQIIDKISPFKIFSATIAVGDIIGDIELLQKSMLTAINCVYYRIKLGTNRIITTMSIQDLKYKNNKEPFYDGKELKDAIIDFDYERIVANISAYKDSLIASRDWTVSNLLSYANDVFQIYIDTRKEFKSVLDNDDEIRREFEIALLNSQNIECLFGSICQKISRMLRNDYQYLRLKEKNPVFIIKQFIKQHYSNTITISQLSQRVDLESKKLNKCFKKEVGIKPLAYLTLHRINIAKELLKNTKLSVEDISTEVGYEKINDFSKTFVKLVGILPDKFRELYY